MGDYWTNRNAHLCQANNFDTLIRNRNFQWFTKMQKFGNCKLNYELVILKNDAKKWSRSSFRNDKINGCKNGCKNGYKNGCKNWCKNGCENGCKNGCKT